MAVTLVSSRRRFVDTAERLAIGGRHWARGEWLLKLGRALVDRDGANAKVDWRTSLEAARHGFLPSSYILYNLSANGRRDYLSDFEYWMGNWYQAYSLVLNGEATNLVRDKLAFYLLSRHFGLPTPEVLAVIKQGRPHFVDERAGPATWADLRSLLDTRSRLVIKPVTGQCGEDVIFLSGSDGAYRINGDERDWAAVEEALRPLDYFLVTEWIQQASYSSDIFPNATNSIRLLVVRRRDRQKAVLAGAAHRFGRGSLPVDNFRRGGLSAAIDPATGTLGRGVCFPDAGELVWHTHHPDTGAAIEGVRIPQWDRIRGCVLEAADRLSFLPYLSWDVVATDGGCTLLETNHNAGIWSLQVHRPLLADPEVRGFFEEHAAFGLSRRSPIRGPVPDANSAKREWLLKLGRALVDRDGATATVDWRTRLEAARHGFLPSSYILYNLSANGRRDYLSDSDRWTRTTRQLRSFALNGEATNLVRDKLAFYFLSRHFGLPTPEVLGVIKQGRPHFVGERAGPGTWADLRSLLDTRSRLVIKPVTGAHGRDVIFLSGSDGAYRINGDERDWAAVEEALRPLDYFLVTEWIQQASYSSDIFPNATNVVRVLTIRLRGEEQAILAAAVHRFGRGSLPVDNFSRGGLSAAVDPATGSLGRGVCFPDAGELVWHTHHPDTGAAIEGVRIPQWDRIRGCVLEAADRLSFLPYLGWDVVATDGGCTLLEANSSPDVDLLQVHGPLLADPQVRAFFEEQGVID